MLVIALSAYRGSGKDLASSLLVDHKGFKRAAFADVLKDMVARDYGIPRSHLDDPEFKEKPILTLPAMPKDAYTQMVLNFMLGELRLANGQAAPRPYVDMTVEKANKEYGQLYHTPRSLAILLGSTNRVVSSDYWVSRAVQLIKEDETSNFFVISDLRYKSEMDSLSKAFGDDVVFVRINRFDDCQSQDPSERDLDRAAFDFYVENKGSMEEFLYKIAELADSLK